MASLVVARAATAAIPSVRGRRLGSGRSALAALSGQGAAVLAVRRHGTGRGGVLAVELKIPFRRPVWAVKATNATEGADSEEEFELVRELKTNIRETSLTVQLSDVDDVQRKYYQIMLEDYSNRSFALWANVANRLRPPAESKVYKGLRLSGETLIRVWVSCSKGRATWKSVSDVVQALDLVRRLVLSTLEVPLPQDWSLSWDASLAEDYDGAERGLIFVLGRTSVLERTYALVERDIKSMLGDDVN